MAPCGVVKCTRGTGWVVVRGVGAVAAVGAAGVAGVDGVVASRPTLVGADPVGLVAAPLHPVAVSTTAGPAAAVSGRRWRTVSRTVGFMDHPEWTGSGGCMTWSLVGTPGVGVELPAGHRDAR
jgi:hypothetical protein